MTVLLGYINFYIFIYVTGSAKTLHSHTSDFTTLTSHKFKSIALNFVYAIEQQ